MLRRQYGYEVVRQSGSHMRLDTAQNGEHHLTIPAGGPLRVGTLAAIITEVGGHLGKTRPEIERELFGGR